MPQPLVQPAISRHPQAHSRPYPNTSNHRTSHTQAHDPRPYPISNRVFILLRRQRLPSFITAINSMPRRLRAFRLLLRPASSKFLKNLLNNHKVTPVHGASPWKAIPTRRRGNLAFQKTKSKFCDCNKLSCVLTGVSTGPIPSQRPNILVSSRGTRSMPKCATQGTWSWTTTVANSSEEVSYFTFD